MPINRVDVRRPLTIFALMWLAVAAVAAGQRGIYPLPEERGASGTLQALDRLPVFARVMYTIAHPDDESGGTLTWLARKAHARVALFSLTRGDGGQNLLGDEKYEAMGIVRTGELIEASRIYGVEPYFASVFEFGFSKSAEETLRKWGKEQTLEELVRFIRGWRPAIIVSQFGGDAGDGHGHHQTVGILTREAFRAAGDPARFPEHLRAGLPPWQAQKLLQRERNGAIRVSVGDHDPVLGRSYAEIGAEGYSRHRSQGNGARYAWPGSEVATYQIVDSVRPPHARDSGFFGDIDTSLLSILELAGDEASKTAELQPLLETAMRAASDARSSFEPARPEKAAPAIAAGLKALRGALGAIHHRLGFTGARVQVMEDALQEKREDFEEALHASLGLFAAATAAEAIAAPGQSVGIHCRLVNRGAEEIELRRINITSDRDISVRPTGETPEGKALAGGAGVAFDLTAEIAATAPATEPFWYRRHATDTRYQLRPVRQPFAPFEKPSITLDVTYRYRGVDAALTRHVRAVTTDPLRGAETVDFQIVPPVSVSIGPSPIVVPISKSASERSLVVAIRGNPYKEVRGQVRLKVPSGWTVNPAQSDFSLDRGSETAQRQFSVRIPAQARAADAAIEAVATIGAEEYARGYQVISHPGNWTRHLYSPARAQVKIFELSAPHGLGVGYIPGAGDEIPQALAQLGANVKALYAEDLANGDLSHFHAIVTGIRAFNVNRALRANNDRLLEYVSRGGVLIAQYSRPEGQGGFPFAPHELALSNDLRITVEDSPIKILVPEHRVFRSPNAIGTRDFEGWVQERGLYFASRWDPQFLPLLAGADPGEPDRPGGMLIARHGKGYWIYTAYAWFRQLPAGVPGAYRILANLVSLGTADRLPGAHPRP